MTNNLVINNNGIATTTSLKVASAFNKRHDDLLKKIKKLNKGFGGLGKIAESYFIASTYLNEQNKEQPCYNISRDGFVLLTMGFTGKKALEFKIKYIEAFNAMEAELKSPSANLQLIASAVVDELRAEGMLKRERTSKHYPFFDGNRYVKVFAHKRLKPGEEKILCADLYESFCIWNEMCHYYPVNPLPSITEFIDTLDVIGYPICADKNGNEFVKCHLVNKNKIAHFGGNFYNFIPCSDFNIANVYHFKDGRYCYAIGYSVRKKQVMICDYDMLNNEIPKKGSREIITLDEFRDLVTHQKAGIYIRDVL